MGINEYDRQHKIAKQERMFLKEINNYCVHLGETTKINIIFSISITMHL